MTETIRKEAVETNPELDSVIAALKSASDDWAQTEIAERLKILQEIKDNLLKVAEGWAEAAARHKLIPEGSPLEGEEWLSGPYALMNACNGLMHTLSQMEGKAFLNHLAKRKTVTGQLAVTVLPHSIWERLLLSGIRAEVWMEKGVDESASPATLPGPMTPRRNPARAGWLWFWGQAISTPSRPWMPSRNSFRNIRLLC